MSILMYLNDVVFTERAIQAARVAIDSLKKYVATKLSLFVRVEYDYNIITNQIRDAGNEMRKETSRICPFQWRS